MKTVILRFLSIGIAEICAAAIIGLLLDGYSNWYAFDVWIAAGLLFLIVAMISRGKLPSANEWYLVLITILAGPIGAVFYAFFGFAVIKKDSVCT